MQVFISYSHKDRGFVSVLSQALGRSSVKVWLDEHQLEIGDHLSQRIEQAINRVDFVIIVISPNSIASQWVNYELSLVLLREGKDNKVRLLPLLLQEDNIPAIIANRLIADFRTAETMNRDFKRLLKVLGIADRVGEQESEAGNFCDCAEPDRLATDYGGWCMECGKPF